MSRGMGFGSCDARERLYKAVDQLGTVRASDLDAMRQDWMKIGGDFRGATKKLETELSRRA